MRDALNGAVSQLSDALCEVEVAVAQVSGAAGELARGSRSLAHGSSTQARAHAEESAAATEELSRQAKVMDRLVARFTLRAACSDSPPGCSDWRSLHDRFPRAIGRPGEMLTAPACSPKATSSTATGDSRRRSPSGGHSISASASAHRPIGPGPAGIRCSS